MCAVIKSALSYTESIIILHSWLTRWCRGIWLILRRILNAFFANWDKDWAT